MKKVRYEIDPYNRLILEDPGVDCDLPIFRQVLDGQFKIDEKNILSYQVKAPLSEDKIPNQIRLKGSWSLDDDHNLRLMFDKSARRTFGDLITLQGEILDVKEDSILFAVTTKSKDDEQSTYVLNLSGSWKADSSNRLSFHVRRQMGRTDILTFNGAWQVNENNQVIYQYEKADLITKKSQTHTLTFKGYWGINKKTRISYILSLDTGSVFDFSASASFFKEDYIQYEIGIGLNNRADPAVNTIILSGVWNLKKDVGLIFEIRCEGTGAGEIVFGADAALTDKDTIIFRLRDNIDNEDLGIELELSRKILEGDGEAFLRLLESQRESAIYAGAAWRW